MSFPSTALRFALHFAKKQWPKFTFCVITGICFAINETFFPYFLKHIVNILQTYQGSTLGMFIALKPILILLVSFWIGMEILQRTQGIMLIYTFPSYRATIRSAVFDYIKQHSHHYFANHFAGNIAKKLGDIPNSCQMIMEIICLQLVTAITGVAIVMVMMWHTKFWLTVIVGIWLIIHLGLTSLFVRFSNPLWIIHSDAVSTLSGKIVDAFSNMLNVRLFARGDYEAQYLEKFQQDELNKAKKAMWHMELIKMGLGINGLGLVFGSLFLLIYGYSQHWITLGDFTQVGMQVFWLLGWIWFISFQLTQFVKETGIVNDALKLIRQKHELTDAPNATALKLTHGAILYQNVHFTYQQTRNPVFSGLTVSIPAGQKVGLVGFSGSGKSTFVNLLLRFFDINSGSILLDQQDIRTVTQDSLRSHIAMIPQDPSLFHRSLMENIRYGRLDATEEEVITASKLAHCHEFIEQLPEGYESLVGERGIKLSGGQRQRIAIARAVLKNAPILILDEATSALDSVTEHLIQDSLERLMAHKTTLVIAHRLSTLAHMDRILVFHQGHIVEDGTLEELRKAKSHFFRLWEMQSNRSGL